MTSFIVFGLNRPENQAQKPFKEGTRTRNKIFILFALIIILIIVSLAGFLFFKKSTNKDQSCQNSQEKKSQNTLNQSPPTGQEKGAPQNLDEIMDTKKRLEELKLKNKFRSFPQNEENEYCVLSLTKDDIKNLELDSLIMTSPWMTSNQIDNIDNEKLVPLILNISTNEKNLSRKKDFIDKLSSDKISKMGTEDLDKIIPRLCMFFQGGESFFEKLTNNQLDSITILSLIYMTNYLSKLNNISGLCEDSSENKQSIKINSRILGTLQRKGKNKEDLTSILDHIEDESNKQKFIQKLDQNQIQLLGENPVVLIDVMDFMSPEQLQWIKGKKKDSIP